MNEQKEQEIRNIVVKQIEQVLALVPDIKGTTLELELNLAIANISQGTKVVDPTPVNPRIMRQEPTDDMWDRYAQHLDEDKHEDFEDDEEDYIPIVPQGFDNEEQYQDFLETQNDVILPLNVTNEFGEEQEVRERPDDVVGVIENEAGELVNVGNMDDSLDKITEIIVENNTIRDDDGEIIVQNEVNEVPTIKVSLTRNDNRELSVGQVEETILRNPVSRPMLQAFGDDYDIEDSEDSVSTKFIVFRIDHNDDTARRAAQGLTYSNGMMQFAGRHVFPGIGMVTLQTILD